MKVFHPSVEGAQHGDKDLAGFLNFASANGALGAQPTCYMLEQKEGGFMPAAVIREMFAQRGLHPDGVSAHCPFWVQTSAWTETETVRPFIPANLRGASSRQIENWAEDYCLHLMDLCAELGVKVIPMFWGLAYGLEVATGYPWGFWKFADPDHGYDLIKEGDERFVNRTRKLREHATDLNLMLAHEIHPGTAAMCGSDFLHVVDLCGVDECLGVNADPSHCWEGETWQDRFDQVGDYVYGCHMKNHYVRPGHPLRSMQPDWKHRAMQFTQLDRGHIGLVRYAEQMLRIGYPERYCKLHGTQTAPLVVEAEGAFASLDQVSGDGIRFVRDVCCFEVAGRSHEEGMGAGAD